LGRSLDRKLKFWIFLLIGVFMFTPLILVSVATRAYLQAAVYISFFLIYCHLNHHFVYKKTKAKYPLVPPEGRMDTYFPRTNIPRPIHEDVQRYQSSSERKGKYIKEQRVQRRKVSLFALFI
jgi:hypothetical protein